jgi:8-oxo-dGTP pyrophosphatase MutT (NUDIX family)
VEDRRLQNYNSWEMENLVIPPVIRPTLEDVRRALALAGFDALTAWLRMAPRLRPMERPSDWEGSARLAGVLILLYPRGSDSSSDLAFVLTRRTETVATHKGQISLPGGAQEGGESIQQTALRETCEELGVRGDSVTLLGSLTPLYVIVSDFTVHPWVGYLPRPPVLHPDPVEVAQVLEMPLADLLADSTKVVERWTLRGMEVDVPFYRVDGLAVWGATAIILSEFESRLRMVLGLGDPRLPVGENFDFL